MSVILCYAWFLVWLRTDSNPADNNRFQSHTGKKILVEKQQPSIINMLKNAQFSPRSMAYKSTSRHWAQKYLAVGLLHLGVVLHLLIQVAKEFFENEWINIFAQLVQKEPVSDAEFAAQCVHLKRILFILIKFLVLKKLSIDL